MFRILHPQPSGKGGIHLKYAIEEGNELRQERNVMRQISPPWGWNRWWTWI